MPAFLCVHACGLLDKTLQVCCDWGKPFDLTDEEKGQFRQVVPLEVTGLKDVLCSNPHTAEVRRQLGGSSRGWCGAVRCGARRRVCRPV